MNEKIDLTKILKDCPCGTKMYSTIHGYITFIRLDLENPTFPILVLLDVNGKEVEDSYTKEGKYFPRFKDDECCLFPSKDQRDWSKFTAPWLKKERFDPKTLQPYDRVLVRDTNVGCWKCTFYSHKKEYEHCICKYATAGSDYKYCIPYNDDTKYLVNTTDEAPEYYRYWED